MIYPIDPKEFIPIANYIGVPSIEVIEKTTYCKAMVFDENKNILGTVRIVIDPGILDDYENDSELILMHLCSRKGININGTPIKE